MLKEHKTIVKLTIGICISLLLSLILKLPTDQPKGDYIILWNRLYKTDGFPYINYNLEYPHLIGLVIVILLNLSHTFEEFMFLNFLLVLASAIICTLILYKLNKITYNVSDNNFVIYWIFAPSMLMYSFWNWDLFGIIFMLASIYFFIRERFSLSAITLGLGICAKLFPILMLPIYFIKINSKKERLKLLTVTLLTCLFFNLPLFLLNPYRWFYPFYWQFVIRPPNPDTPWGAITNLLAGGYIGPYIVENMFLAEFIGFIILAILAITYIETLIVRKKMDIIRLTFYSFLVFLFFSKVYSPQYNLWILPFFTLLSPPLLLFYIFDLISFVIIGAKLVVIETYQNLFIPILALLLLRHLALALMIRWERKNFSM